jgi:tetratricopeptide (TPR) repeat protein
MKRGEYIPVIVLIVSALLILGGVPQRAWAINQAALITSRSVISNEKNLSLAYGALNRLQERSCGAKWLLGVVAGRLGASDVRALAWKQALTCPEDYTLLVSVQNPKDPELAELGVRLHPESAAAWFWLAETKSQMVVGLTTPLPGQSLEEVIGLFQKGLKLAPFDGLRWRELGDLYNPFDPQAAIQAYANSCLNGDPGSNGCYRAGSMSEKVGDFSGAINYYRQSHWQTARQRGDELEQQMLKPQIP